MRKNGAPDRAAAIPTTIGLIGWVCAGPLVATLLVGRTALFLPSARWVAVAVLSWLATGAVAWLAGPHPVTSARRDGQHRQPWYSTGVRLLPSLSLLGCAALLLPQLYLDDGAYHVVASGAAHTLSVYLLFLVVLGSLFRRLAVSLREESRVPSHRDLDSGRGTRDSTHLPLAPLLAVTLMLGANYGILGSLQASAPNPVPAVWPMLMNLTLGGVAAFFGARAWGSPPSAAVAAGLAWLAFAPWRESLAIAPGFGLALLLGATGLFALSRRQEVAGGTLLGGLTVLVPPALAGVLALAILGKWRAALAGSAVAAALFLLAAVLPAPSIQLLRPDSWLGTEDSGLSRAIAGTPHLANAALGAFYARLFSGPGALTASTPLPVARPGLALTLGTLAVGSCLCALAIWRVRAGRYEREDGVAGSGAFEAVGLAVCLALAGGLFLVGTAPRPQLAPAMLAILPFAGRRTWSDLQAHGRGWVFAVAGLLAAGYLLTGTSVPALGTAAAPLLSRWPALASLPAFGLGLLVAALAFTLRGHTLRGHTTASQLPYGGDGRDV